MVEAQDAGNSFLFDVNIRLRDFEEKNKMLRERILLIGQNLIETKKKELPTS